MVVAALAFPLLAAPSVSGAQSPEPIKIGFSTELSGPYSFFGNACMQGMRFAEKRINAMGGALHRPLQFVVADNQTNPAQAAASARSLDVQEHVLAVSGPTSSDNALAIYGYAEQNKMPYGPVQNSAGKFVKAGLESVTSAAAGAAKAMPADFRVSITNAPGENTYPIASFTWLLIPEKIADPKKGKAIVGFLHWMLKEGQSHAPALLYAPLPKEVVAMEEQAIGKISY